MAGANGAGEARGGVGRASESRQQWQLLWHLCEPGGLTLRNGAGEQGEAPFGPGGCCRGWRPRGLTTLRRRRDYNGCLTQIRAPLIFKFEAHHKVPPTLPVERPHRGIFGRTRLHFRLRLHGRNGATRRGGVASGPQRTTRHLFIPFLPVPI